MHANSAVVRREPGAQKPSPLRVAVPTRNLQFLAFWVAIGGRLFAECGLALDREAVRVAQEPLGAPLALMAGDADIAVLPPPLYLRLIAQRQMVRLCANLLANDPLNVVVTADAAREIRLAPGGPVREALRALRGLRLGVASGPRARLQDLLAWAGLGRTDVDLVPLTGAEQEPAFFAGHVDGLYAHTPHLERALVDGGGVLACHLSRGESPLCRIAQVHALVVPAALAQARPDIPEALRRGVGAAQDLIRRDPDRAVALLAVALEGDAGGLTSAHLRTTVDLYRPAMPPAPTVTAATLRAADRLRATGSGIAGMGDRELAPFIWPAQGH